MYKLERVSIVVFICWCMQKFLAFNFIFLKLKKTGYSVPNLSLSNEKKTYYKIAFSVRTLDQGSQILWVDAWFAFSLWLSNLILSLRCIFGRE